MTDIFLQNTLTGTKEKFVPLKEGEVSMYNCGPTVYDYAHIGNFRTFILNDLLRRMFECNGLQVNQVMNVTDVDDKTIKRSREEGVNLKELTGKYEKIFFDDLASLNILLPTQVLRATENISEMISMIEKLLEKGVAYKSSDGIYFDIFKSDSYGKLAHLNLEHTAKERVVNDEYDKENPRDFSLWKFHTPEDGEVAFDAPFGKGRPGWHIECSAMSLKALGETIDVHTGGQDLIFPHHTNEIAQSEAVTGKPFVKEWVHGGFITVDGKKMSKSLGNIITLETLRAKGIDPLAFRYFVLSAHYSSPLNFTWGAVEGTESAYKKLKELRKYYKDLGVWDYVTAGFEWLLVNKNIKKYRNDFLTCINDDLNIPKAIALLWTLVKDNNIPKPFKKKLMLDFDKVLGLGLEKIEEVKIPEEVRKLIIWRDEARAEKDFVKSDELRKKIEELGFSVQDTDSGTKVTKNPKFLL